MRLVLTLSAGVVAAGTLASSAFAHATVVETSPRAGAVVASAPADVRVRFDDPVSIAPGNEVVSNSGGSMLVGRARLAAHNRELVLPVRRLRNSDYSVRWRIVSDDGHLEEGVFAFRIGTGGGAAGPQSVLTAASARPSTVEVLARWLYLGGILVAGGTSLFGLLVTRVGPPRAALTLAFALSAVVVGGASLLHSTHAGATRFGHVTEVALVVAAAGAAAAALSRAYPRLLAVATAVALGLLAAPSLAGHALDAGRPRPLSFTADLAHVVAAAFWIGGLLQLVLLLRDGDASAARRFSKLGLPAVVLLAVAGGTRALGELSAVSQLWTTGYGRAIVAKTALFGALLVLAWTSRRSLAAPGRLLRSVSAELAVLAIVVGVVALLVALRPGRDAVAAPARPAANEVAPPPTPPSGAVVFARESRELAVALAVRPGRPLQLTATILGQSGYGVDGLDVELIATRGTHGASNRARPCGHGCYATALPFAAPTQFAVNIGGKDAFRSVAFPLEGPWPPRRGTGFLKRATQEFRHLQTAVYLERLASGTGRSILTTWKLEAPDRLEYAIRGGAGGIVIGTTRWDRERPGGRWTRSSTTRLPQPFPPWGTKFEDVRLLQETPRTVTLSWVDPTSPAWFTATFDRKSALPKVLRMTAAAHFMHDRYGSFNRPVRIAPPPG